MKKLLLLAFVTIMMMGCKRESPKGLNKYEVVLSSKDTIYIDAYDFVVKRGANYVFMDYYFNIVAAINSPIYVKQLKSR